MFVVEIAQLLEAEQLLVNNMDKHLLVLELADVVQAALHEDLRDFLQGVETFLRVDLQGLQLVLIIGRLEHLDQLFLSLSCEL